MGRAPCHVHLPWYATGPRLQQAIAAQSFRNPQMLELLVTSGLPTPPDLGGATPRSKFNAVSLAYLGDAIYETLLRQHVVAKAQETAWHRVDGRKLTQASAAEANATRQAQYYDALVATCTSPAPRQAAMQPAPAASSTAATGPSTSESSSAPCSSSDSVTTRQNAAAMDQVMGAGGRARLAATSPGQAAAAAAVVAGGRQVASSAGKGFGASKPAAEAPARAASGSKKKKSRAGDGGSQGQPQVAGTQVPMSQESVMADGAAVGGAPSITSDQASTSTHTPTSTSKPAPPGTAPPSVAPSARPLAFSLTPDERDVLKWGTNAHGLNPPKAVDARVYKKATALEVLVAHLYLTDPARCIELVQALLNSKLPPAKNKATSTL